MFERTLSRGDRLLKRRLPSAVARWWRELCAVCDRMASCAKLPFGLKVGKAAGAKKGRKHDKFAHQRAELSSRRHPGNAAALGLARCARADGHQVRLRYRAVRRLHRASGWRSGALLPAAGRRDRLRPVITIEAVGATPNGQKIQQAWLDLEVVQCGYC